MFIVGISL